MNDELMAIVADMREQLQYMRELGVDRLDADAEMFAGAHSRAVIPTAAVPNPAPVERRDFTAPPELSQFVPPPPNIVSEIVIKKTEDRPSPKDGSRLTALPSLSKRPTAVPKKKDMAESKPAETVPAERQPLIVEPAAEGSNESVAQIQEEIGPQCMRCKLSQLGRRQVVHSTGNTSAQLMFAGEAPGADEDEQGFPFVGRAGQLLTKIIESIGFRREDVFIGNINRCRPPGNRAPEPDETAACRPFLEREIAVVRPKVIVVLGATAAHNLLQTKVPISKLRGQFHDHLGSKVMPTFHPAYLLRDPNKKREVWEDMKKVRDYLSSL
jgi:DNA polymerase